MAAITLAILAGVSLVCLTCLWLWQGSDHRRLELYAQELTAERQFDALSRATLTAMRSAVREASRFGQ